MHSTQRVSGPLRWTSTILTTVSVLAGAALTYRIWRASEVGIIEAFTSLATAILVISAVSTGWAIHVRQLRARVESAEWIAARARREETVLDGNEDRELWDSVDPKTIDEDTCGIGLNVVAIRRFRYPEAG